MRLKGPVLCLLYSVMFVSLLLDPQGVLTVSHMIHDPFIYGILATNKCSDFSRNSVIQSVVKSETGIAPDLWSVIKHSD